MTSTMFHFPRARTLYHKSSLLLLYYTGSLLTDSLLLSIQSSVVVNPQLCATNPLDLKPSSRILLDAHPHPHLLP